MNIIDIADFAKRVINTILLRQQARGIAGGLLGVAIIFLHNILSTWLMGRGNGPLYEGDQWHLFVLGMFIVYVPTIYKLSISASEFDQDIEEAFKAIRKAKEEGMPITHARMKYMQLCEKVLERVEVRRRDQSAATKVKD